MSRHLTSRWMVSLALMGSGAFVLQGCPSGTGRFLATTAQPVIAQILASIANAITRGIV